MVVALGVVRLHLLDGMGERQSGVEVFAVDHGRLVYPAHLVKDAIGQGYTDVPPVFSSMLSESFPALEPDCHSRWTTQKAAAQANEAEDPIDRHERMTEAGKRSGRPEWPNVGLQAPQFEEIYPRGGVAL
ncbi:hypothetical protein [Sphingomonas sanguinis]|uniref:hypothetical protein n=1 Tax=Sphingomonas sanguinis TaxID=33051 RepID=UPI00187D0AF0|nr:hypothetical protein [Sphingomonas sanguinis]